MSQGLGWVFTFAIGCMLFWRSVCRRSVDELSILPLPAQKRSESCALLLVVWWLRMVTDQITTHSRPRWTCSETWPLAWATPLTLSIHGLSVLFFRFFLFLISFFFALETVTELAELWFVLVSVSLFAQSMNVFSTIQNCSHGRRPGRKDLCGVVHAC